MILSAYNPTQRAECRRLRVYLDGVEVTHDCEIVILDEPDEASAVRLLKRDDNGRPYIDPATRKAAREWRFGHVVLEAKVV